MNTIDVFDAVEVHWFLRQRLDSTSRYRTGGGVGKIFFNTKSVTKVDLEMPKIAWRTIKTLPKQQSYQSREFCHFNGIQVEIIFKKWFIAIVCLKITHKLVNT